MKINLALFFTTFILLFTSCGDGCENCDPLFENNQIEFTNLGDAQEHLFRLDSIIAIPGSDTLVSEYILRESISSNLNASIGEAMYDVSTELSSDGGQTFVPSAQSAYRVIQSDIIRQYGNISYLVLNLPAKINKSWNGSTFFNSIPSEVIIDGEPVDVFKGEWVESFTITSFNEEETIEGITHDSVITVTQADIQALTEIRYVIEKYAWKKGLVYREIQIFDEFCDQAGDPCRDDLPWPIRADRGFLVKQWRIN